MTSELSKLPDFAALQQLARALWHNGSIRGAALMVGAGFSKNAVLQAPDAKVPPNWAELLKELVVQLYPDKEEREGAPQDPLRIAEEYRTYFGQSGLDGFIRTRFPDRAWLPGPLHADLLNFPWSDVLTTNWDTLLERTADDVTDFIYEVVRTENDIAQARSPRIVKLHGTLGDKDPLIFATEDYRTYPTRHAAFVNLARQIFIENDLCLLGFSGNDPNFLEWAGWVRDQLGASARRIYLVGLLGLSAPARRYLENHNIAPIDLAPLVRHLPPRERHAAAAKKFFEALRAEKPAEPHEWNQHSHNDYFFGNRGDAFPQKLFKDEAFAAEILVKTTQLLREDRKTYPGWLVCPRQYHDPHWTFVGALLKPSVLARLSLADRAAALDEFLWRTAIGLQRLSAPLRDALVAIMQETAPPVEQGLRLRFALALMREARVREEEADFQKWNAVVENEASADDPTRVDAAYQRCLWHRDQLDMDALAKAVNDLESEEPLWRLRKAGLLSEVGEYTKAMRTVREAAAGLEKAYRLDRNSLWIKSCIAWATLVDRAAAIGNFGGSTLLPRLREFPHLHIDPSGHLEALDAEAQKLMRDQREAAVITPLFDIGTYRPGDPQGAGQYRDRALGCLYELDQLIETVGLPMRLNHVNIAASSASSILESCHYLGFRWYSWLIRALHSHYDKPFNIRFGRIAIAQIPPTVFVPLTAELERAIEFWCERYRRSAGEEAKADRSIALDELRLALVLQSHLTVRMSAEQAVRAFQQGFHVTQDRALAHGWILMAAAELVKYALEALPSERQAALIRDLLQVPLSGERGSQFPGWPNFFQRLHNLTIERDYSDLRWSQRVAELLEMASSDGEARSEAITRLAYLADRSTLTDAERNAFGAALWSKLDDGEPALPLNTRLLASQIAKLPAPAGIDASERVGARVLGMDLAAVLRLQGPSFDTRVVGQKLSLLASLQNFGPMKFPIPSQRAAEIFDQIVSWRPTPTGDDFHAGFVRNFEDDVRQRAGAILAYAIVPAMEKTDRTQDRLTALVDFINAAQSWNAISALPEFLMKVPAMKDPVERIIRRNLAAADNVRINSACNALMRWSTFVKAKELPDIPPALLEQMLIIVETRPEDGLHAVLYALATLIEAGAFANQDLSRLMHTLAELRGEARYENVALDSRQAVVVPLVRQQCIALARALKGHVNDDGTLEAWLMEEQSDPLPEVRFGNREH